MKPEYRDLLTEIKHGRKNRDDVLLLIKKENLKYYRPEIILFNRKNSNYGGGKGYIQLNNYRWWRKLFEKDSKEEKACKELLMFKKKFKWLYSGKGAGVWNNIYILPQDTDPIFLLKAIKELRWKKIKKYLPNCNIN
jgi:hypothetical protein